MPNYLPKLKNTDIHLGLDCDSFYSYNQVEGWGWNLSETDVQVKTNPPCIVHMKTKLNSSPWAWRKCMGN